MIGQPELQIEVVPSSRYVTLSGDTNVTKDEMLLKLLDELIRSWLDTMTPIEIGSDVNKIRLLREARAQVDEGEPSALVRDVYEEVFLEDVWSGVRSPNTRGTT